MTRAIPNVFLNLILMTGIFCWFVYQQTESFQTLWIAAPLVAIQAGRALYWRGLRVRGHDFSVDRQRRMLHFVWLLCLALCTGFAFVCMLTLTAPDIFVQSTIAVLTMASSIAIALHLFALPRAALGPLWSATISTTYVFVHSGNSVLMAAAAALLGVAVATTRLLRIQFDNFADLVGSRDEIDRMHDEALDLAMTDALTGLANRRMFETRLAAHARAGIPFAIAILDLDGFKPVNDLFGHAVGDRLLVEAALRMRQSADGALVARMGGDEFALLIENVAGDADALSLARRVTARVADRYEIDGVVAPMGASCGLAMWRAPGDEARLVVRADIALYQAKARDRGAVVLFTDQLEGEAQRRALIEAGLRTAADVDQFSVCFQPIVDLASGEIVSFEALARWRHPELGEISPDVFIRVAEQAGLIEIVTDRLLRKAARAATRWPARVSLSFNLSALQLVRPNSAATILDTLAECGLSPRRFKAEVTETAVMSDFTAAVATLSALRLSGVRVAVDDFGSGYSSFGKLCELPIDDVKIDKSLVDRISVDERAGSIVAAIVGMCAGLGLASVAEGVERADQKARLLEFGCRKAQGYLFARPMSEEQALDLLEASRVELRQSA
ncbi:MAG TPA: EAL domain-containing protein [Rhodoblastus sp.]|nr:EAL domain-containing protein [Rhodoblastus sp.]